MRSLSFGVWQSSFSTVADGEEAFCVFPSDVSCKLQAPACLLNTLILQGKKRSDSCRKGRSVSLDYLPSGWGLRVRAQ